MPSSNDELAEGAFAPQEVEVAADENENGETGHAAHHGDGKVGGGAVHDRGSHALEERRERVVEHDGSCRSGDIRERDNPAPELEEDPEQVLGDLGQVTEEDPLG